MSQPNETNRQVVWIAENIAYDDWRIVSEAEAQDEASWAVPERLMSYEGFRLYKAEILCEVRKDPITAQIIRTTQAPTYEDGIAKNKRREPPQDPVQHLGGECKRIGSPLLP